MDALRFGLPFCSYINAIPKTHQNTIGLKEDKIKQIRESLLYGVSKIARSKRSKIKGDGVELLEKYKLLEKTLRECPYKHIIQSIPKDWFSVASLDRHNDKLHLYFDKDLKLEEYKLQFQVTTKLFRQWEIFCDVDISQIDSQTDQNTKHIELSMSQVNGGKNNNEAISKILGNGFIRNEDGVLFRLALVNKDQSILCPNWFFFRTGTIGVLHYVARMINVYGSDQINEESDDLLRKDGSQSSTSSLSSNKRKRKPNQTEGTVIHYGSVQSLKRKRDLSNETQQDETNTKQQKIEDSIPQET